MKRTWTSEHSIVIDEIYRFDGKATPEKQAKAWHNAPHMVSEACPMVLGYLDGELIAWVWTCGSTEPGISICRKNDCIVRHGEDYYVFPAHMVEELLKKTRQ